VIWLWIGGALALLIGVPLVIGACTEREHSATVARSYAASPDAVWSVISDFGRMAEWRAGVSKVEELDPVDGQRRIREHTKFGPMTFALQREDRPHVMVLGIVDEGQGFGGTWTYELSEADGGTQLRITEDGFVDNLFFRFMAKYVFGYERTMRAYHDSLSAKLGG